MRSADTTAVSTMGVNSLPLALVVFMCAMGCYLYHCSCEGHHLIHRRCDGLLGPIPAALGDLKQLRKLWLHDNQLSGTSGHVRAYLITARPLHDLAVSSTDTSFVVAPHNCNGAQTTLAAVCRNPG